MPQEVVILSGVGDADMKADGAVARLHAAQGNIKNLWNRGWDLKHTAVLMASRAIGSHDRTLYDKAAADYAEGDRWLRRAQEQMRENDTLRYNLLSEIGRSLNLTADARAWFTAPGGLSVPAEYDRAQGGMPFGRLPEFA